MTKSARKDLITRGKGLLSPSGPQARFILFLIFVLVGYTFLLRIFQKMAEIVDLPVFLPITLVALLVFIGIAATLYSHRFVGPIVRIRSTLERVAAGDCHVTLRLRESDDPMMKDLAETIGRVCARGRRTQDAVKLTTEDLFRALADLDAAVRSDAPPDDLKARMEALRARKTALEQAIRSMEA